MKKFEVFVPVDLRITLEALNAAEASAKGDRVADLFLSDATAYKLNVASVGAVAVEIVPVAEDIDDTPDVLEVNEVAEAGTVDKLGRYPEVSGRANDIATDILLNLGRPSNGERFEQLRKEMGVDVVSGPSTPSVCPIVKAEAEVNPDGI